MNGINVMVVIIITLQTEGGECYVLVKGHHVISSVCLHLEVLLLLSQFGVPGETDFQRKIRCRSCNGAGAQDLHTPGGGG